MRTLLLLLAALPLAAQFDPFLSKSVPRSPDGQPDLKAAAPKLPGGKPDMTGVWWIKPTFEENDLSSPGSGPPIFVNILSPQPPTAAPMTPAGLQVFGERATAFSKDSPLARCLPIGVPGSYLLPVPTKIIHTPEVLVMLFEATNSYRTIFLDGRTLPKEPVPTWMGYSVGHWEGDTLVAESSGFNDKTWIDVIGHPRSEQHRMLERITRPDTGHLRIQVTFDDPVYYQRPWSVNLELELNADGEPFEYVCLENEKDQKHLVGR